MLLRSKLGLGCIYIQSVCIGRERCGKVKKLINENLEWVTIDSLGETEGQEK